MAYRYTEEQKAQAIILLAANRGNVALTSSQLGISSHAINGWVKKEEINPSPDIGRGMETAITYLMGQIPTLVNKFNIAELLGVLLEKYLQYQGIPQNSTQTILAVLATKSGNDLDRMIKDIDLGQQLALNDKGAVSTIEKALAAQGLLGLAETGVPEEIAGPKAREMVNTPTEVIDLIDYGKSNYELPDDDGEDGIDLADATDSGGEEEW